MKTRTFVAIFMVMLLAAATLTAVGVRLASSAEQSTATADPVYISQVFPDNQVIEVNIVIPNADWQEILASPMNEEYYAATVIINGQKVKDVGFRVKGNSSLMSVANSDSERFSFKIDFDQYITGQDLGGLTKLNLNNNFSDASSMREYLAYQAFAELGVPTPAMAYAQVSINGNLQGLYLAVEGIEESFVERYYGEAAGALYKPEGAGADLKWRGDSPSDYPGIVQENKNVTGDDQALIEMLRALDTGENLEQYLDVDASLRYLAVSTALVNFDSYQGQMLHNYYLYDHDGQFVILPWDLNMALGGFGGASSVYIDEPTMGAVADRPLIAKLLAVPEYLERYHSYLRQVTEGFLSQARMQSAVSELDQLIRPFIANDPTKFYTLEQYDAGLNGSSGLLAYANNQAANIQKQLAGELPATNNGQGSPSSMGGGAGGMPGGNGVPQAGDNPGGIPQMGGGMPRLPAGVDMQALQPIIQEARGGALSDASKARLLEMGIDEAMITQLTKGGLPGGQIPGNPPAGGQAAGQGEPVRPNVGGPAGPLGQGQGSAQTNLLTRYGIYIAGGLIMLQLAALVFIFRFRRRRFVA